MRRTTIKTLHTLVETLNETTNAPHNRRYILDCAYGGYRLAKLVSDSGGEQDITPRYGAAVTADLIRAYMKGVSNA